MLWKLWRNLLAKETGRSFGTLDIRSCKMDVSVAWSFVSRSLSGTSLRG
jgi:hypothetical protein